MPKSRILVIDDEAAIRDSLRMTLEYEGYEFIGAATGQEGLALAEREAPDLVLLDVKMPGMDGIEVLERLRNMNDALPVVVVSGHGTISTAVEATKKGAFDFIEKPFASERVLVSLRNALDQRQLRDENRSLKKAVEVRHQMVGDSQALKQVMASVARAAPTNATVLITGESGVGKELVARTIHRNSLRSRDRFVQVNCAAIPEELIESELFGHEKGSFTGATEKQVGKFEQADHGTIFLDEVGDMSAKTQAKVLRVLQEGEVERLGSARTIKVDVRVIAATNKNLEEEIEKGSFREDLYFRLAVIPIQVPPLRERPDDIIELAEYFLALHRDFRKLRLSQAACDALVMYRWPGNVRELQRVIEHAIALADGDALRLEDLPPSVLDGYAPALLPAFQSFDTMRAWGSRYARMVYERCDENKRRTCRELGISYHTLIAYLRYRPELRRGVAAAKRAGLPPATENGAGRADGPQRCAPDQSGGLQW
jgi:two-component system nitrogen regulation response regulator NtrX